MVDAVALIPGFLGFKRGYFSTEFIAGLKAALAARGHEGIQVAPRGLPGVASLATRQQRLRKELHLRPPPKAKPGRRANKPPPPPTRWHLVGHSAGGVDAQLLLATHELRLDRLHGSQLSDAELDWGTSSIGSVVTLASPNDGTGLANEINLRHGAKLAWDVARRLDRLCARVGWVRSVIRAGATPRKIVLHDDLAKDLAPDIVAKLTREAVRRDVPLFSIATVAPAPDPATVDRLFADLWTWTAEGVAAGAGTSTPPPSLSDPGIPWIGSGLRPATIDAADNDGVVNTDRQVLGELAALVLADHADVIGQYRRGGRGGILTSDAHFGLPELTLLVERIADCIDAGIRRVPLPPAARRPTLSTAS